MQQISRELLFPSLRFGRTENKEFKTDTPFRDYGLTAALSVYKLT
jgi:hypothetical protein